MGQVTWRQPPSPIAPGRKGVVFFPHIGNGVEAVAPPRVAAAKARQSEPAALPGSILVDGLAAHSPSRRAGAGSSRRGEARSSSDRRDRRKHARLGEARAKLSRGALLTWLQCLRHALAAWRAGPLLPTLGFDLADGVLHRVEHKQRRGVARFIVLDRLEGCEIAPAALRRGPPAFSILRIAAPTSRSSAALDPTISRPITAAEDWPSRQAFTLWP